MHAQLTRLNPTPLRKISYLEIWYRICNLTLATPFRNSQPGEEKVMVAGNSKTDKDWRQLCAEVLDETDPRRMVSLVNQILEAFDERDQNVSASQTNPDEQVTVKL